MNEANYMIDYLGEHKCDVCQSTDVLIKTLNGQCSVSCIACAKKKSGVQGVIAWRVVSERGAAYRKLGEIRIKKPFGFIFSKLRFSFFFKQKTSKFQLVYTEQFIPKELLA
jgi:hypothetical protein